MKRIIYFLIALTLSACSDSSNVAGKKSELEKLKKEMATLKEKISFLEAELASGDTLSVKTKIVSLTEIKPQNFSHFIEIQAKVEGDQDVQLSAEASGTVKSVLVNAGDKVGIGQVLVVIDDKLISQGIAELQSQLDFATQLYNRQKNLWEQKIGSEVQFLQAKTNKESLERKMDQLKQQQDMTRIKSPINGTVDEVHIKVGQTVMPGLPAIRVVNLSELKVKGEVAESFISKVRKGNEVILIFPDQKKELKTTISYSGTRIDPINRTFLVEANLSEKQGVFHPNMIAVMKIADYINTSAYAVPVGAVQKSSDGEFVYIAHKEGSKTIVKRKTVQTGMIYSGFVEIVSGLSEGDMVITNGYQNIIEGDAIRI